MDLDDDLDYDFINHVTWPEDYCDWCETDGHTFRSCPRRDDA